MSKAKKGSRYISARQYWAGYPHIHGRGLIFSSSHGLVKCFAISCESLLRIALGLPQDENVAQPLLVPVSQTLVRLRGIALGGPEDLTGAARDAHGLAWNPPRTVRGAPSLVSPRHGPEVAPETADSLFSELKVCGRSVFGVFQTTLFQGRH